MWLSDLVNIHSTAPFIGRLLKGNTLNNVSARTCIITKNIYDEAKKIMNQLAKGAIFLSAEACDTCSEATEEKLEMWDLFSGGDYSGIQTSSSAIK